MNSSETRKGECSRGRFTRPGDARETQKVGYTIHGVCFVVIWMRRQYEAFAFRALMDTSSHVASRWCAGIGRRQ